MSKPDTDYALRLINDARSFPEVERLRVKFLATRDGLFSFKGSQAARDAIEVALARATRRLWGEVIPSRADRARNDVNALAYERGWRIANGDYFSKALAETDRVLLAEASAREWAILVAGPDVVEDARSGRHSAWRVVARGPADGHRDSIERADAWLLENGTAEMYAGPK